MEETKKAIETAYASQVIVLYNVFAQALLAAGGDQQDIADAEAKFSKGLSHANDVLTRALALANK